MGQQPPAYPVPGADLEHPGEADEDRHRHADGHERVGQRPHDELGYMHDESFARRAGRPAPRSARSARRGGGGARRQPGIAVVRRAGTRAQLRRGPRGRSRGHARARARRRAGRSRDDPPPSGRSAGAQWDRPRRAGRCRRCLPRSVAGGPATDNGPATAAGRTDVLNASGGPAAAPREGRTVRPGRPLRAARRRRWGSLCCAARVSTWGQRRR